MKVSGTPPPPKETPLTDDMASTDKQTYHHGELPEVLMALAVQAIEAKGTEALSLRALAREAGVSATAPYRHFPSKSGLLADIATQGFIKLRAAMSVRLAEHDNIDERVIAMGLSYIDFAVENPVPYKLMFGSVLADFSEFEMLQEAAQESYTQLLDELRRLIKERALDITPLELGGVVWSGVHGMASLMINNSPGQTNLQIKKLSEPNAAALQSVATLHADTERAMRFLFGNIISSQPS